MPRPKPEKMQRRGQRDLTLPQHERRWEVGAPEHGMRLDAFLSARVAWRSRTGVREFIRAGAVEVLPFKDPQQATVGALREGLKLRTGQEVVLRLPEPDPAALIAADDETGPEVELDVLYEDEQVLAVSKPPHISVHPSHGHLTGSLIHLIHQRHRRRGGPGEVPTLCHRLDRETTGVVLSAKDALSRTRLGRQFEARAIGKTYLALVAGEMEQAQGVIDLPLGKALTSTVRLKMGVRHDADGQPARTAWKVARRLPGRTLVELQPETGRQHQLRVHLAAIGHPIVGDKLYQGGDEVFVRAVNDGLTAEDRALLELDHHALHAWRLSFEHPFTGRRMTVEAPLWPDVAALAGD